MPDFDLSLLLYGLAIGLAGGAIGGTLAGLAGVGGGLIYVPLFYVAMPRQADTLSLEVLGSLVAVFMTGFFSARAHWRLGHVHGGALRRLLPGLLIGAAFGLWSTLRIPEAMILMTLAALDGWIAWDYGRHSSARADSAPLAALSGPIGYISGALGVGGGTLLVPLLRRLLPLRHAVGTSSACGMAMAGSAVILNLLLEAQWRPQLAGQWPFLAGAWLGILLVLPHASGWAARLHRRWSEEQMRMVLKMLFAGLSATLLFAAVTAL